MNQLQRFGAFLQGKGVVSMEAPIDYFISEFRHLGPMGIKQQEQAIISVCSRAFNVDPHLLFTNLNKAPYPDCRCMVMQFLYGTTGLTLQKIGHICGHRDHSSVIHGMEKYAAHYDCEADFKRIADESMAKLGLKQRRDPKHIDRYITTPI